MKQYFITLFILIIPFFSTSCDGGDNNEEPNETASIVGKWKPIKIDSYENNVLVDTETIPHNASCPDYTEFKNNSTFQSVTYNDLCTMDIEVQGTYTFQNNTLSTTIDGFTDSLPVTSLTATELQITETYTESGVVVKEVTNFQRL